MIYGDEPLMVVIIDVYIWCRSLTITISYFGEGQKCHHKLIGDGQKSIRHQKLIFVIPYIWISEHDGIEPPTSCL